MALNREYLKLHGDLPRQGAGADWCTREAILRLPPLRKPPAVLDWGCGTGRQTVILAQHFRSTIQAVDGCPLFLDHMMEHARAAGVADWVQPLAAPADPAARYDLIWSEGGASALGMAQALSLWAPLLRGRGVMALTDQTWLTSSPPPEAAAYWRDAAPMMTDVDGAVRIAQAAGLKVYDHFVLPRSAWWDDYYAPLARRIAALRGEADANPALGQLLEARQAEISLFERCGDSYGAVFYLMRLA